jgi:hypothetical protein
MPQVGFKPMISAFERMKTFHALECETIEMAVLPQYQ